MRVKILISIASGMLLVGHLIWPNATIDLISLGLLVVGVLPWLSSVIKSLELPGGFKIELADIKAATDQVTAGATQKTLDALAPGTPVVVDATWTPTENDANLALVGLRIEIEKRLQNLAEGLPDKNLRGPGRLLQALVQAGRVDPHTANGLQELIALGNQAAHGADVAPQAARWAIDMGPRVMGVLDALVAQRSPPPAPSQSSAILQ